MEKLSRDELDRTLDSLKKLRNDESRQDNIAYMVASCYLSVGPTYYSWERLPYEFICPNCGKHFGKKIDQEDIHKHWADGDSTARYDVNSWDLESILEDYEKCKEAGYDVMLKMHCLECIKTHSVSPAVFRFCAPGEREYTVSYPQLEFYTGPCWIKEFNARPKRLSDKHFFPWQYSIAISFITEHSVDNDDAAIEDVYRKLLEMSSRECEEEPRAYVFDAIEGILGLSLK